MHKLIDLNNKIIEIQNDEEYVGLYILKGDEKITSDIVFLHKHPQTYSRITLKFVLLDRSQIDIKATVQIDRGARNTDTYLKIDTLLLSEDANAHVVPSMEIKEDNVKGGHGATIGMLDENQLWYLMSRGLSEKLAEQLLIKSFVDQLLEKIQDPQIKESLRSDIEKYL